MRIVHDIACFPPGLRGGVAAMGNFDGLHLGHRAVLAQTEALARQRGAPFLALTFEPHPRQFFRPDLPAFRLTPLADKARLLRALPVDGLVVLPFNAALAATTAEDFMALLRGPAGIAHVVVGGDFRFGKDRRGSPEMLAACPGLAFSVAAEVPGPDGGPCSSTRIRELVQAGDCAAAAGLLGRPLEFQGRVRRGDQRGRTLGFPTLNLDMAAYLPPRHGVYAARCGLPSGRPVPAARDRDLTWVDAVANFGRRPTLGGGRPLLEVHLPGFSGDLYGATVRVQLLEFLRPERKFAGLDALKAQITEDTATALGWLRRHGGG